MPGAMRERQKTFDQTGSNHAAALFDREARLIDLAEDIGRHNAVDKVIGRAAERSLAAGEKSPEGSEKDRVDVKSDPRLTAWPLGDHVLFVSGRISFEITQKALMAGIGVIGAVSGVSSLAVDLAEEHGMTIAGFVRGDSMTVYAGAWRVVPAQG
jgi:FdhD protein